MSTTELNEQVIHVSAEDRALIKAVGHGLPVVSHPYAEIAKQLDTTEQDVISRLQHLIDNGAIKRYGVVVRHKELGYTANGMVVWDVPDDRVEELGMCIGMVHGSSREEVTKKVAEIVENCNLQNIEHTILFSTRRFKQRGASYTEKNYTPKEETPVQTTAKNKSTRLHLVK